jgi:hypothetical protein
MFVIIHIFHSFISGETVLTYVFVLEQTHFFQLEYSRHQFVVLYHVFLLPKEPINYIIFNSRFWYRISTVIVVKFISQVRVLEWIHSSTNLVFLVVPISVASLLGGLYSLLPAFNRLLSLGGGHLNHVLQREGVSGLGAHFLAVSHLLL